MQKGDIQGPPYVMPDDIELTFLRKFIERQSAGIAHNPRLRNAAGENNSLAFRSNSVDSGVSEPSEHAMVDHHHARVLAGEFTDFLLLSARLTSRSELGSENSSIHLPESDSRMSASPLMHNADSLAQQASTSSEILFFNSLTRSSTHFSSRANTSKFSRGSRARSERDTRCFPEIYDLSRD